MIGVFGPTEELYRILVALESYPYDGCDVVSGTVVIRWLAELRRGLP